MAHISSNTRCAPDIVEAQGSNERVALEQEGEGLADTSSGTEDGNLGLAGSGRGEEAGRGGGEGTDSCASEHGVLIFLKWWS